LRAEGDLLGFYHSEHAALATECIVGRAVGGLELLDGGSVIRSHGRRGAERNYFPARSFEAGIDALPTRLLLKLSWWHQHSPLSLKSTHECHHHKATNGVMPPQPFIPTSLR
jgi:hypothetical protein